MRALLILNILLSYHSFGQSSSNDSLFALFKKDIQIELSRYHNHIKWDDETKESYYQLMISCPIDSLTKYVEDSIPAIRCIIFHGLANKNVSNHILEEIINKHQYDTALYIPSPTDVVIKWSVIGYMQFILYRKLRNKISASDSNYSSLLENLRNRQQSDIRVIVPGVYHGMITKEILLSIDSLTCSIDGYTVISFSLSNDGKTIATDNIFTKEIKELIKTMKSGDYIYIDNILVQGPDERKRKFNSVVLKLQ